MSPYEHLTPSMTVGQQLARWREATGQAEPTTVPIVCTLTVGRCTITTENGRFPSTEARALIASKRRKLKPRALPKAAKFASFAGGGYHDLQRALVAQEAAWRRAITTGAWA